MKTNSLLRKYFNFRLILFKMSNLTISIIMKPQTYKKLVHIADEIFVLLFTWIGVMFSEVILDKAKGQAITSIHFSLPQILISGFIAFMVYSKFYSKMSPSELKKPPYLKRISQALATGTLWRSAVAITE